MIVNRARDRGALRRDEIDPALLALEADLTPSDVPGGAATFLALRSHPELALLGEGRVSFRDLPRHPEAERVRLERKGRQLLDHCLAEKSAVCVIGFVEHEFAKSPAGARFVLEFAGLLLHERVAAEDELRRELIDLMIDRALDLVFGRT